MLQSFDCKNELIGVGLKQVMNRKGIIFLLVGVLLGIGGGKWYTMYGNDSKNKVENIPSSIRARYSISTAGEQMKSILESV